MGRVVRRTAVLLVLGPGPAETADPAEGTSAATAAGATEDSGNVKAGSVAAGCNAKLCRGTAAD